MASCVEEEDAVAGLRRAGLRLAAPLHFPVPQPPLSHRDPLRLSPLSLHTHLRQILTKLDPELALDDEEYFENWKTEFLDELSRETQILEEEKKKKKVEAKKGSQTEQKTDPVDEEDETMEKCDYCVLRDYSKLIGPPNDLRQRITEPFEDKLGGWLRSQLRTIEWPSESESDEEDSWAVAESAPSQELQQKQEEANSELEEEKQEENPEVVDYFENETVESSGGKRGEERESSEEEAEKKKGKETESEEEKKKDAKLKNLEEPEEEVDSDEEREKEASMRGVEREKRMREEIEGLQLRLDIHARDIGENEILQIVVDTLTPNEEHAASASKKSIRLIDALVPEGLSLVDFVLPREMKEFEEESEDEAEEEKLDLVEAAVANPYPNLFTLEPVVDDDGKIVGYEEGVDEEAEEKDEGTAGVVDWDLVGMMGSDWATETDRLLGPQSSSFAFLPKKPHSDFRGRNNELPSLDWEEDEEEEWSREEMEEMRELKEVGRRVLGEGAEPDVWPELLTTDVDDYDTTAALLEALTGGSFEIEPSSDEEMDVKVPDKIFKVWKLEEDFEEQQELAEEAKKIDEEETLKKRSDKPVPFLAKLNEEIEKYDEPGKYIDESTRRARETITWPYVPRYTFLKPYKSHADLKDLVVESEPNLGETLRREESEEEVRACVRRVVEKAEAWQRGGGGGGGAESPVAAADLREESDDGSYVVWTESEGDGDSPDEDETEDFDFPVRAEEAVVLDDVEALAETESDHKWRLGVERFFVDDGIENPEVGRPWSLEAAARRTLRRMKEAAEDGSDDDAEEGEEEEDGSDDEEEETWKKSWEPERDRLESGVDYEREARLWAEMARREALAGGPQLWQGSRLDRPLSTLQQIDKKVSKERVVSIKAVTGEQESSRYRWAYRMKSIKNTPTGLLVPDPPITWPFPLDPFQQQAIMALEAGTHVFVAAHTSAGKTVVAEYAIAKSKRHGTKVVYTSPIKALSNQKFKDFREKFGSVGLITGDLQVNEEAECLVMTTEILCSMLYNGSARITELEFVIFDEVHYINDPERGHVWEEVLILLPREVKIVMLSATVPNTMEFADWLGRTKGRRVAVCTTTHRPVPLKHYLFMPGTNSSNKQECFLIRDGDKDCLLQGYRQARDSFENRKKRKPTTQIPNTVETLVRYLEEKELLPAVIFCFSRKKCDKLAQQMTTEFTTSREKWEVTTFLKNQIRKLDPVDRKIKQIEELKLLLTKGIGVHHSGILPILKEIVEVLFQKGIVKLLFATETFAVGVNMPARTVVFESVEKFDGLSERTLKPAEFTQMAGRAGRRGRDHAGYVFLPTVHTRRGDLLSETVLREMMLGKPCELSSQFRLTYSMILATLRTKGEITVQGMMRKSLRENEKQMNQSTYESQLEQKWKDEDLLRRQLIEKMGVELFTKVETYHDKATAYFERWDRLRGIMLKQTKLVKLLEPGRLVKVTYGAHVNSTGMLLSERTAPERKYKVFLFKIPPDLQVNVEEEESRGKLGESSTERWRRIVSLDGRAVDLVQARSYEVLDLHPHHIVEILDHRILFKSADTEQILNDFDNQKNNLRNRNQSTKTEDCVNYLEQQMKSNLRCLDETGLFGNLQDLDLEEELVVLWSCRDDVDATRRRLTTTVPNFYSQLGGVFFWKEVQGQRKDLQSRLSEESMSLYKDYERKMQMLKKRNYINESEIVSMRGSMASRVGKFELTVTELLLDNVLKESTAQEVAAALSCLVYQAKAADSDTGQDPDSRERMTPGLVKLIEQVKRIVEDIRKDERELEIYDEEYTKINFGLVLPMFKWASGASFNEVMDTVPDFQAGLMVRWIQQLLEMLKDVESAAKVMGDPGVPALLREATASVKRGIVFAPSIYTSLPDQDRD